MIDFEKEIAKYGNSLSEMEKDAARRTFNELLEKGFSFEWLYYAVQRLEGRSILKCPKLMFYRPFQEEVNAMMEAVNRPKAAQQRRLEKTMAPFAVVRSRVGKHSCIQTFRMLSKANAAPQQ